MEELFARGISTRPATHAVHLLSYYKHKYSIKYDDYPNAFLADKCGISFPLFHGLTDEEQGYVIEQTTESM